MAIARGSIRQRSRDSLTIIAPTSRDPETGKYRQVWRTVKRRRNETDSQLRARAERELRKLLTQIDEDEPIESGGLKLADYVIKEWLPAVSLNVSPRTADAYEAIMRDHVLPVIGLKELRKLQPADVERVYRRMAEKGLSGNTRLHCHRALSQALKAAVRRGALTRNVCDLVDAPRKESYSVQPPTPDEVGRLIKAASNTPIDVLVRLLAHTGLRLGEALGLRWQDVDLDREVLHVRQTRKEREPEDFGQPKTERSRRSVELTSDLVTALRKHRARQTEFYLSNGLVPIQDLVFTTVSKSGVVGMSHNQVSNHWKSVRLRAGVPHVRIHDLRHFAATTMINAGVPLPDVSAVLGHGKTSTTADIYAHVIPGRGRAAVGEIEKALSGK